MSVAPIDCCVKSSFPSFVHVCDVLLLIEKIFDSLLIKMTLLNGSPVLQSLNIV